MTSATLRDTYYVSIFHTSDSVKSCMSNYSGKAPTSSARDLQHFLPDRIGLPGNSDSNRNNTITIVNSKSNSNNDNNNDNNSYTNGPSHYRPPASDKWETQEMKHVPDETPDVAT